MPGVCSSDSDDDDDDDDGILSPESRPNTATSNTGGSSPAVVALTTKVCYIILINMLNTLDVTCAK